MLCSVGSESPELIPAEGNLDLLSAPQLCVPHGTVWPHAGSAGGAADNHGLGHLQRNALVH